MLFLVGSPIGNLSDITLRALEVLKEVTLVATEDTRRSSILLRRFEISKPLVSFHEHNEARRTGELIEKMRAGAKIALITDAGMPSISDPGIRVEVIPGPSALLTALVASGLPTDRFYFGGFLPVKSGQREREVVAALAREVTSIYFESPFRLVRTLEAIYREDPTRSVCVARELTKQFEEYQRGAVERVLSHYRTNPPKGEITLVISGKQR
jgi:16S rRNA (cytidine1402-2'-O)-methyltransferase